MYKVITLLGPMLGMIGSSYIMHYFAISGLASYEVTEDSANHVLKDYEFGPEGDIAEKRGRSEVDYIVMGAADDVPRKVWMWLELLIMEQDSCTRYKAQDILKPRDTRMTYAIAVLKDGRSDAVGRNLRAVRKLDYKETRTNEPRRDESSVLGQCILAGDRGRIQNKAKWGWRLLERMMAYYGNPAGRDIESV